MSPTPTDRADYPGLLAWIRAQRRVLIATHTKPDGDAYGSAFAAWRLLRDLGIPATVFIKDPVAYRYTDFIPSEPGALVIGQDIDLADYSGLLCLDSARANRVDLPAAAEPVALAAQHRLSLANVDHHIDNPRYGDLALVDPSTGATCEILAKLARDEAIRIAADTATSALVGCYTDTGGFRFSNTTPQILSLTAWLLEQGADHDTVVRAIYFNDKIGYLKLQAHVVENMTLAFDGRFAYFQLTPDDLDRFGVSNADSEDLIDVVRVIRGVKIACRMHQIGDDIRFSFRSMDRDLPIIGIAHAIGGGGHAMAAGATGTHMDLATAETLVLKHVKELLDGSESKG